MNKELNLTGIFNQPEKIYLLAGKQQKPLKFNHTGVFTRIG
jgi:hypothetical protein